MFPNGVHGFFIVGADGALRGISGGIGTGDVVGPAGATNGNLTVFDGATGKLVKDGGPVPSGAGTPSATVADLDGVSAAGASTDYSRGDHKHGGGTLYLVPTVDESVSNDTLQDDDVLFFAALANSVYVVEGFLFFESGASSAVDAKIGFTLPAGATMSFCGHGLVSSATAQVAHIPFNRSLNSSPTTAIALGVVASSPSSFTFLGVVRTAGTAGDVKLQWAQNTLTGGTPLVRDKDSYMTYRKVA